MADFRSEARVTSQASSTSAAVVLSLATCCSSGFQPLCHFNTVPAHLGLLMSVMVILFGTIAGPFVLCFQNGGSFEKVGLIQNIFNMLKHILQIIFNPHCSIVVL